MTLRVVFRADASTRTGQGHVMRCLALADYLRNNGAACSFISARLPGNLIDTVRHKGFRVDEIAPFDRSDWMKDALASTAVLGNESIDWIVVDHYGLDGQWESVLKQHTDYLMVIDDLADRRHTCDLLLDQNPGRMPQDYQALIDPRCELLIGPSFALLREEFRHQRNLGKSAANDPVGKMLISLGGTDADNVTGNVLSVLESAHIESLSRVSIILGAQAPWLEALREQARTSHLPIEIIVNPDNMAELLSDADLAIGAAGVSALERCCVGLPTLLIVTASNQHPGAAALHSVGAAHYLGTTSDFADSLRDLLHRAVPTAHWQTMSARAQEIVDGEGCARVAYVMSQSVAQPQRRASVAIAAASLSPGVLRPLGSDDLPMIFAWRNHPDVRRFMRHSVMLDWHEHLKWFERKKIDGNLPLVFEIDGIPLGFVQFDMTQEPDTAEWGFYKSPDAPQGIGRRLGVAAISHGFQHYEIDRLIGKVMPDNLRSQQFHERLGFHRTPPSAHDENLSATPQLIFSLSRSKWSGAGDSCHGEKHECHC